MRRRRGNVVAPAQVFSWHWAAVARCLHSRRVLKGKRTFDAHFYRRHAEGEVRNRCNRKTFYLTMDLVVKLSLLLALFWSGEVRAQDGYFSRGHNMWHHGFYQTLIRPDTKTPCCNLTDCRPTSGRQVEDHYEVKVNGAWVSVPPDKILKRVAPDLGFHVCAPFKFDGQPHHLYCVVIPPES